MSSSALCVMTDFRKVPVATVGPDATLGQATDEMIAHGVRLLIVVEAERVLGLITARDTQGERPVQIVRERRLRFDDLRVRDLMAPLETMDLLELGRVMHAEVGDIVATLKNWGRQHALVGESDPTTGATRIRGVFSATQIGRQLGLPVQTSTLPGPSRRSRPPCRRNIERGFRVAAGGQACARSHRRFPYF
jgi:CBS domain-containing protein